MNNTHPQQLLSQLCTQWPATMVGTTVIDVIADAHTLPRRGCDIELKQQDINVGGCALSTVVTLERLGIDACNALPLGQEVWADIVRSRMAKEGLHSRIDNAGSDNGWCLAPMELDGERTFMSLSGIENQWNVARLVQLNIPRHSLAYLLGYQLTSPCGKLLIQWLEGLEETTPFIDFGPHTDDIPEPLLARIMVCRPLVSFNRQEAEIATEWSALSQDVEGFGVEWVQRFTAPVVIRHDKGSARCFSTQTSDCVPALVTVVIDTIGVGDSHAGGMLAGLTPGWVLTDSVLLGNAVAS